MNVARPRGIEYALYTARQPTPVAAGSGCLLLALHGELFLLDFEEPNHNTISGPLGKSSQEGRCRLDQKNLKSTQTSRQKFRSTMQCDEPLFTEYRQRGEPRHCRGKGKGFVEVVARQAFPLISIRECIAWRPAMFPSRSLTISLHNLFLEPWNMHPHTLCQRETLGGLAPQTYPPLSLGHPFM